MSKMLRMAGRIRATVSRAGDRGLSAASCLGANPRLFDQTDPIRATLALSYCRACPITALCLEVVRPDKSHYDGVAGGSVWSNGREVGRLTQAPRRSR